MSEKKKNKAVFVDRDGTINYDCPYCSDPSQLRLYEDIAGILKPYQDGGYLLIIVTNQSGVNRGYFTEDQLRKFNGAVITELSRSGIKIDDVYFCPHRPDEGCSCRKPETGMVDRAEKEHEIDISQSLMIGDREDIDGELARRKGLKYINLNRG